MMLEPQTGELRHEHEYWLDESVEAGELDAGSRMVLLIYGERPRIDAILEGTHWLPCDAGITTSGTAFDKYTNKRNRKAAQLAAYASELLDQLDPLHRHGAMLLSVARLRQGIDGMASVMAYWAIEDSCEGGCMQPFDRKQYGQRQLERRDRKPFRRVNRQLHDPKWIRRYLNTISEPAQMRAVYGVLRQRRASLVDTCQDTEPAWSIFDADYARQRAGFDARQRQAYDRIMATPAEPIPDIAVRIKLSRKDRAIRRQSRKIAVRSALFAAGLIGASSVNAFVSGRPVYIDGHEAVFEVSRRYSVHLKGMGAIDINLMDKDRTKLAGLCLYVEGTPALDQLSALALAVQSGEEREMIATANLLNITPDGAGHALLDGRQEYRNEIMTRLREAAGTPAVSLIIYHDARSAREARNSAYWQETGGMWIDTLGKYVFGYDWKKVKPVVGD